MNDKPQFYQGRDYARLSFCNGHYYYGYGYGHKIGHRKDEEWCFVANIVDGEIIIPFSRLGAKDMFDVVDCLMIGIGLISEHLVVLEDKEEKRHE